MEHKFIKDCPSCGYKITEALEYCPKCGLDLFSHCLYSDGICCNTKKNEHETKKEIGKIPIQESKIEDDFIRICNDTEYNAVEVYLESKLYENTFMHRVKAATIIQKLTNSSCSESQEAVNELVADTSLKQGYITFIREQLKVFCPKCSSNLIVFDNKGFSWKKALIGGVLTGGIGIIAGFHGRGKLIGKCLYCGNKWKI